MKRSTSISPAATSSAAGARRFLTICSRSISAPRRTPRMCPARASTPSPSSRSTDSCAASRRCRRACLRAKDAQPWRWLALARAASSFCSRSNTACGKRSRAPGSMPAGCRSSWCPTSPTSCRAFRRCFARASTPFWPRAGSPLSPARPSRASRPDVSCLRATVRSPPTRSYGPRKRRRRAGWRRRDCRSTPAAFFGLTKRCALSDATTSSRRATRSRFPAASCRNRASTPCARGRRLRRTSGAR